MTIGVLEMIYTVLFSLKKKVISRSGCGGACLYED